MVPHGADAAVVVAHIEACHPDGATLIKVCRSAAPGQFIGLAASDLARRDTVLPATTSVRSCAASRGFCVRSALYLARLKKAPQHSRRSPKFQKLRRGSDSSRCSRMIEDAQL